MFFNHLPTSLGAAQAIISHLQQELVAAQRQYAALRQEQDERLEQLHATHQRLAQEIAQRRRLEAALQDTTLRLRALVEHSTDIILLLDAQGGCLYASPVVEQILGHAPATLVGHSLFTHVHPAEQRRVRRELQACLAAAEDDRPFRCRLRVNSGAWRYLEGRSCNRLHDAAVGAIVLNLRDVTEHRRATARIRRLHRTLEREARTRTAQLQLAYTFEATLKRITDKVRDSLDKDQIMQAVVQELAQAIPGTSCNAALYDLEQETAVVRYEHTHLPAPYQGRTLDLAAYPELYAQLLQGKTFQFCSLSPNRQRGKVALLAQPILDDAKVLGDLWLSNQPHYGFTAQDVRLVQQVANQCAIALRQSQLYQAAQARVAELALLNQRKDDFLNTVSHELRAPMANIKMSTQMLAMQLPTLDPDPDNSIQRYVQILQDECQRETSLINDLLDLARLDSGNAALERTTLDVEEQLLRVVVAFQGRMQQQHQHLQLDIASDLPPLASHEASFNRIMTELLHNACKYTPPHEQIAIAALMQAPSEPPLESAAASRSAPLPELQITVANTGVDIAPADCDRLFDEFYRIPANDLRQQGGTGLGLSLVKKLVEHLGGAIAVTSAHNRIAFTWRLPLVP